MERKKLWRYAEKPWEEEEADISKIFENTIEKALAEKASNPAAADKWSPDRAYRKIGYNLAAYVGLNESIGNMDELIQKFSLLGHFVAYLCDKYYDKTLICEEPVWLGSLKPSETSSGEHHFEFSKPIRKRIPNDCTQPELDGMFLSYLRAQRDYWCKKGERYAFVKKQLGAEADGSQEYAATLVVSKGR